MTTLKEFVKLNPERKIRYARDAVGHPDKFQILLDWLKDKKRVHNQSEDEEIILTLHKMADRFIEEGILLPPPHLIGAFLIPYASDKLENYFDNYNKKYIQYPSRDMTETDKKLLVKYSIINGVIDKIINCLITYNLMPEIQIEIDYYYTPILHSLDKLTNEKIKNLFEYMKKRGDYERLGLENIYNFLDEKTKHTNPTAVAKYSFARDLIEKELNMIQAHEIQTAYNTAEPNSLLYSLPENIANTITEFATGLNYKNYKNTKGGYRKRQTRRKLKQIRRKLKSRRHI